MQLNCSMRSILISVLVPTVACGSVFAQNTATLENSKPQNRPVRSSTAPALQAETPLRIQRAQMANTSSVNTSAAAKPTTTAMTGKPSVVASAKPGANASPLERGKYFSRHGAYSDAYNFFTKAADADPKNPEAYNRRARVEWQLEKNDEALEDVRYAIKLNPDYAEAFCTRAAILNSTEHYHDAIVDTALAIELKPRLKEAYTIQASAYRNLKQYREADELMQKLAAIKDPISAFDEWSPTIDYTQYITDLQSRVRQHFQGPMGVYPPIVVLFKLHRSGQITEVRVNNAGVATADNAAVEAAKASAPFNQPPAGAPPDFDVFVVLDPPTQEASAMIDAPAAAQAQAPAAAAPKAGINWGSLTNTGLNTGLNLMRFIHF
ncbi:hypothetical protein BH10CYA1_BH10CYA1_04520 [soil metagenome]